MSQKIKLELTEVEAHALTRAIDAEMRETAEMMRKVSPVKDYLWFAHLRDQYQTAERLFNKLREPQLV